MVNLTGIYGNAISVAHDTRKPLRQYSGFSGAHGSTAMLLGSRGYKIFVQGTLRVQIAGSYAAARSSLEGLIVAIEQQNWVAAATYTFMGSTFNKVVFDDAFKPERDASGKMFFIAGGYLICRFTARLRGLV